MISEIELHKIMNGPDYFRCPYALGATMRKEACVKRQTDGIFNIGIGGWRSVPEECHDCKKGKEIKKEMGNHILTGPPDDQGVALKGDEKMEEVRTKKCRNPKCGKEKPLDEFPPNKQCKDGYENICKVCRRSKQMEYYHRKKQGKVKKQEVPPTGPLRSESAKIPEKKPNGHPVFYKLLREMARIHSIKNADYGAGSPLGNFMEARKIGIEPWQGALVRMTDKYSRVMSLAGGREPAVKEESIKDTLIDLANYALLTIVLMEEEKTA